MVSSRITLERGLGPGPLLDVDRHRRNLAGLRACDGVCGAFFGSSSQDTSFRAFGLARKLPVQIYCGGRTQPPPRSSTPAFGEARSTNAPCFRITLPSRYRYLCQAHRSCGIRVGTATHAVLELRSLAQGLSLILRLCSVSTTVVRLP